MKGLRWLLLWLLVLGLLGCAQRERIMLPPAVDLGDTQRLAVVYWENFTLDPGLSLELERALVEQLDDYYNVLDPYDVESTLHRLGIRRGMPLTRAVAVEIGEFLDADLVVGGEVQYYFEDVRRSTPQREEPFPPGTGFQWHVNHTATATVVISGRIFSSSDGQVVYATEVEGRRAVSVKETLQWTEEGPPPEHLLPAVDRSQLPRARQAAVAEAAKQFTSELLPRYEWRRIQ